MTLKPLTSQTIDARLPGVQRDLYASDLEAKLIDLWTAEEETIEYFRFDPAAEEWVTARDNVSGFHTTVFSRLPLPLNRMIGALVYPHLD